jgi:hypothetical protein
VWRVNGFAGYTEVATAPIPGAQLNALRPIAPSVLSAAIATPIALDPAATYILSICAPFDQPYGLLYNQFALNQGATRHAGWYYTGPDYSDPTNNCVRSYSWWHDQSGGMFLTSATFATEVNYTCPAPPSPSPTSTQSPSASPSASVMPTVAASPSVSRTASPSPSRRPSASPTRSPSASPQPLTQKVTLRSPVSGLYMSVNPDCSVAADRATASTWELWTAVRLSSGKFTFKSFHGRYLSAQPGGTVVADRAVADLWEQFDLIVVPGTQKWTLRS